MAKNIETRYGKGISLSKLFSLEKMAIEQKNLSSKELEDINREVEFAKEKIRKDRNYQELLETNKNASSVLESLYYEKLIYLCQSMAKVLYLSDCKTNEDILNVKHKLFSHTYKITIKGRNMFYLHWENILNSLEFTGLEEILRRILIENEDDIYYLTVFGTDGDYDLQFQIPTSYIEYNFQFKQLIHILAGYSKYE